MTKAQAKSKDRRGRPEFNEDDSVSARLLRAAIELFGRNEFGAVSLRQIAKKAGVNTAMVHYYFVDKAGMYNAMVETVALPVEKVLIEIASRDDLSIKEFINTWITTLADNPWYINFILRETIIGQSPIHDTWSERIRTNLAPAMLRALENDRKNGRIREGLDLSFVILSLSSLLTYPFLVRSILEKTMGFSYDHEFINTLKAHTINIVSHGILTNEETDIS